MPPTKTSTSRSTANGVLQTFRVNGRRYRLRTAPPRPDRARSRFARGVRIAEMRERTQHGRLSMRKMLPLMRSRDPELVQIIIRERRSS
jgi:hypothetical protein